MKTYVLMIAVKFPMMHCNAGYPTGFKEKIACGVFCPCSCSDCNVNCPKIHTIRGNYDLWEKRVQKINDGKAILSIRYWSGIPYRSKQVELCKLEEVGLQKLVNPANFIFAYINDKQIDWSEIAKNDGLSFNEFCDWFRVESDQPMAIIHFTGFRY